MMGSKGMMLAVGGLAGLLASLLTLGGCLLLGPAAGAGLGGMAGIGLGVLGSLLLMGVLTRQFSEHLLHCKEPERLGHLPKRLGWDSLDRELEGLHQAIARSHRAQHELELIFKELHTTSRIPRARNGASRGNRPGMGDVRELIADIRAAAGGIVEAARALGETAQGMASGALDQKETVTQTTNTVEALSDRIDRISENAEQAAGATERTRQQANRGLEQIQGVIAGTDRLRAHMEANARKVRRLGERSVEIGTIVELISGISSRTDMLALNATIESVRAGEHGRGFAVVAEEIRKLAERTAAATREIGTLVEAIQADTHESIRALAEEQAEMDQEVSTVREAGSALERISRMAEDSARLVDDISRSANDQVHATQDLVTGMRRISEASRRIQGEATQLREDSQTLGTRCDPLLQLSGVGASPGDHDVGDSRLSSLPRSNGALMAFEASR